MWGSCGVLASHNAADERGQSRQVSGDMACGCARIALCQGVTYGNEYLRRLSLIASASWFSFFSQDGIDDEATSLKCPFHNA